MNNIVIFGASGHAKVVADIIMLRGEYNIVGVISPIKESICGINYLGADDDIAVLVKEHNLIGGVIAIGDSFIRKKIAEKISNLCPNFIFIKAIHPSAIIAKTVEIADGAMVMAGAIINSHTVVGKHCIINTHATIEHDNVIEDFVNISPSVTTGGNVTIRSGAFIGIGATILPNISMGSAAVVGAGSLLCKDMPKNVVCYGVPARIIEKRD